MGDLCELGSQLRAHVVWFGEDVPMINKAAQICQKADILFFVGSSLTVYPAAGLLNLVPPEVPKYIIDPVIPEIYGSSKYVTIEKKASVSVPKLVEELLQ